MSTGRTQSSDLAHGRCLVAWWLCFLAHMSHGEGGRSWKGVIRTSSCCCCFYPQAARKQQPLLLLLHIVLAKPPLLWLLVTISNRSKGKKVGFVAFEIIKRNPGVESIFFRRGQKNMFVSICNVQCTRYYAALIGFITFILSNKEGCWFGLLFSVIKRPDERK